jgi:hypothetical protein
MPVERSAGQEGRLGGGGWGEVGGKWARWADAKVRFYRPRLEGAGRLPEEGSQMPRRARE